MYLNAQGTQQEWVHETPLVDILQLKVTARLKQQKPDQLVVRKGQYLSMSNCRTEKMSLRVYMNLC